MSKLSEENVVGTGAIAGVGVPNPTVPNQAEPGFKRNGKTPDTIKRKSMNIFKDHYKKLTEAKVEQPQQQEPANKDAISNSVASELFARCRAVATTTHFAHLSTDSFSEHQALSTFYTDIIDKIDAFCEAYIGKYGKFITLPPIQAQMQLAVDAISELGEWISQNRSLITDDSSLQNSIDEIADLINVTVYKLQKLK